MVRDGSFLTATIDHAVAAASGQRPDLRRFRIPVGPVGVWAASNFPCAFGVVGGDTASALAAGCPVVVKAHPGHPSLSEALRLCVEAALSTANAPAGAFGVVQGDWAGTRLISDVRIEAAAFTGSVEAGRALWDRATQRRRPIPFFGELGSVNPVFVTERAAHQRTDEIACGFVSAVTLGNGQLCTKPGLLFVPAASGLTELIAGQLAKVSAAPILNAHVSRRFHDSVLRLRNHSAVGLLATGRAVEVDDDVTSWAVPSLTQSTIEAFMSDPEQLVAECFGPTAMIVTYRDEQQLMGTADVLPGSLTATIHGELDDVDRLAPLMRRLVSVAGRLIWNDWPTGLAVTWSTQHGGPYPSSTAAGTTSVGGEAIDRFLRLIALQNYPESALPPPVQSANPLGLRPTGRRSLVQA